MGAPRRKNIIQSRRRVEDEDEEEEGALAVGAEDDSLSEGSAISDADDDADAEGSEASDTDSIDRRHVKSKTVANGQPMVPSKKKIQSTNMHDVEVMMNGLNISADSNERDERKNETLEETLEQPAAQEEKEAALSVPPAEMRRREHEEYKKKRDADPAFVPNRGGFFMHDHRSAAPGQNGFRPFGKNKGKGRGVGGSSPAAG